MPESLSPRRVARSRPVLFWAYAAVSLVLLVLLMYVVADRATPSSTTLQRTDTSLVEASTAVENEFVPTERNLSECISAIPKPGCGSEARGGWRQTLVLLLIVGGLGVIAWRIVASARTARSGEAPASSQR